MVHYQRSGDNCANLSGQNVNQVCICLKRRPVLDGQAFFFLKNQENGAR